jgi:transcriptional regulator with PAS, ATPase and Fis domain
VPVNCGAIPENLIESELFGHVRGSFTGAVSDKPGLFELASGGTLFLDEIGELPLSLQVKLLRALQEKVIRRVGGTSDLRVDVRVVAATNRNLEASVSQGSFREDLFYRLNVITIQTPPLRDREGDIRLLAEEFLKRFSARQGKKLKGFESDAMAFLEAYPWPGNVRELENTVERAVTLTDPDSERVARLALAQIDTGIYAATADGTSSVGAPSAQEPLVFEVPDFSKGPVSLEQAVLRLQDFYLKHAQAFVAGNPKKAAALVGLKSLPKGKKKEPSSR